MKPAETALADQMRQHGERMSAGLYQQLLFAFADDLDAGGVVAEVCRDWLDAPASEVVQLRLLAGLQRLALTRQAAQLVMYYPNLGGGADPATAWPVFEPVLKEHSEQLRADLLIAPQTNEPGRAAALLVGIFDAVSRSMLDRIRLLEVGASAGLNLLVDRFRIGGVDPVSWFSGPVDSPLRFDQAVHGAIAPASYRIISRRGCDLSPIDPLSQDGRLRLTSFVWPQHLQRHERLRAALQVAAAFPVTVDEDSAAHWLADQLAQPVDPDVLTVVWHSVTKQYWPASEAAAVDELIAQAGQQQPIAQIAMESPMTRSAELTVQLRVPGLLTDPQPVVLATVADHGVPVQLV